ncbi:hypothetical protein BJP05_06290 [Corynebacterium sp. NML98-0116]|mgnify:CR=1 FL=1|uniref:hypothetical protein n=1 Tax=Corynebacterium TaxID=1716 RepID=UPI000877F903|nr:MULTISPECIES: hypothetical protein [Corynebacterium]AOX05799.1 hypothetical protein BJP05_06290 [Corynebacterium sp. NML98-0116]MCQ4607081.1 hypothetical protein [Corynebacterium pseudogenitalium]MCQ4609430.1 hypothetical protein [Corynebacterium sp. CCUG 61414]MCQ4611996.1 hypothetical protein [Corynebacterium sp. CCUG 51687]MDK8363525.1 hypothetical protein [Corynebacterium sp. UMB10119B]
MFYESTIAQEIIHRFDDTVQALSATVKHPRSLARPTGSWRPPVIALPRVIDKQHINLALTRRRVGPRAQAMVQGYGASARPAYIIEARFTAQSGAPVNPAVAEGWMRALYPDATEDMLHLLPHPYAATYVWLVDGHFDPVRSPSSLFAGLNVA